jgi:hypothetical protein
MTRMTTWGWMAWMTTWRSGAWLMLGGLFTDRKVEKSENI